MLLLYLVGTGTELYLSVAVISVGTGTELYLSVTVFL